MVAQGLGRLCSRAYPSPQHAGTRARYAGARLESCQGCLPCRDSLQGALRLRRPLRGGRQIAVRRAPLKWLRSSPGLLHPRRRSSSSPTPPNIALNDSRIFYVPSDPKVRPSESEVRSNPKDGPNFFIYPRFEGLEAREGRENVPAMFTIIF
jgi:hypothetical protein